jgi:hypothetical protein
MEQGELFGGGNERLRIEAQDRLASPSHFVPASTQPWLAQLQPSFFAGAGVVQRRVGVLAIQELHPSS